MHTAHQPVGWHPYPISHQNFAHQPINVNAAYQWMYPTYYYPANPTLNQSISNFHHNEQSQHLEQLERGFGTKKKEKVTKNASHPTRLAPDPVPVSMPLAAPAHQKKCVNLCADWCNRNLSSSPVYEGRDDDVDSVLSRSSNGSLSPHRPNHHHHHHPTVVQTGAMIPWTEPLSRWLSTHKHRPYPTKREKQRLSEMSGRSIEEISSWLSSARRALKQKYDDERDLISGNSRVNTEMPDNWRMMPEMAERNMILQKKTTPSQIIDPANRGVVQTTMTTLHVPHLFKASPTSNSADNERPMPVLMPQSESSSRNHPDVHDRFTPSPDLLSPLVIDTDRRKTTDTEDLATDVPMSTSMTSSSDVDTSSVTSDSSSPVEARTGYDKSFMKHKRRMMERFMKEETSGRVSSPEKSCRKQYNNLELSAVDALISMGTHVELDFVERR